MHQEVIHLYNAQILRDHQIRPGELWVHNGKIVEPQSNSDREIDVKGRLIAPGYIDIQINGGFGVDLTSEPEKLNILSENLPRHGVTSFLPTMVSSTKEDYNYLLPKLREAMQHVSGAQPIGIHLEGPYIHIEYKGAHSAEAVRQAFTADSLDSVYGSFDDVKIVTLAPELPQALPFISYLNSLGIVVSAGHTAAKYEEASEGVKAGIVLFTHLYNAMTPLHHRAPGCVGAALTLPCVSYSIIADGVHLHPTAFSVAWQSNPKGLILVTDAMAAFGLEDGTYSLGNMQVEKIGNRAVLAGTQILAGSVLSMDAAVRNMIQFTGCSVVEAIESASLKPARLLKIDDCKGHLQPGADADFIILDESLHVIQTFISGCLIN